MATDDSVNPSNTARQAKAAAPELRLLDRRAFVGFPPLDVAPGVVLTDFALQIPDVTFPFNVSQGALRYQKKKLNFGLLELSVDAEVIRRAVTEVAGELLELDELKLHFRVGYLEGQARFKTGERAPLTFKAAFDGDGERLAIYLYDVRLYGFSATPSAVVPTLLARSVKALELLPDVELLGASGFSSRVLPPLCQLAAVGRGFKMPTLDGARLAAVEVSPAGLKLRFAAGGLPPPTAPDDELLLTLEGTRAFADAEALLAQNKLAEARDAYLRSSDPHEAHPFAAERLLSLLVADPQAHELALDVAETLGRRRERSPAALWAEAVVRERRGENARAAERYLALCALARRNQEETAAFFAAESAARAARDQAPQMAVKALHEVLGLRPDHLPSLQALARASDQARDRAGAIRAYRRMTALARDPGEAAEAHVQLARLCAITEDDVAGARLHCEAALRLAPDHPEALYQLGELCFRSGEHLRALKALDRLKDVALGRHELDRVGRAHLLAGRVWESGLNQKDNALLRYREAVALLPGEPEPLYYSARVAESLGRLQEAIAGYVQTVELAGPAPRSEEILRASHSAHHALARLYQTRLGDPTKAREHLEAALALDPRDQGALEQLIPSFRALGKLPELAAALEKASALESDPLPRAVFLAEAGELHRARLGQPDKAEKLLLAALDADGRNRMALEGLLALAEGRRDGPLLTRCLRTLAELSTEPKERVRYLRRLAVAGKDLAFDLELAAYALTEVLKAEPEDLPALGELCAIQRKRADMPGLAAALEQRARVAEGQHDSRLAAAAMRELAQVLEARLGRPGEALVALEKAARLAPDVSTLLELAELSLRCERPEHARRALDDVLQQLPKHAAPERLAEVRAKLGRACELCGDKEAAARHYAQALPLRKLDDELAQRLESLYQEQGRTKELSELWTTRAQALIAAERPEAAAPLLLKSARALLDSGNREAAAHRLSSALELAPQGPQAGEVLESLAELELAQGNSLEAAKLWGRRAALLEDGRAAAKLYLRAAQLAQGTPREDGFLAEALGRDPSYVPARVRRAELTLEQDPARALDDLEAALQELEGATDAASARERLTLTRRAATAATRLGQVETARRHLRTYAAGHPDDLAVQRELADLHRRAGDREALLEVLGKLWPQLSAAEAPKVAREYAELALALGRGPAAVEALQHLLALAPRDVWAASTLLGLFDRGEVPGATPQQMLPLLSTLIAESTPTERVSFYVRRARLHRSLGALGDARTDLDAAAKSSTAPGPLRQEEAELAREAGDPVGELTAWRAVLAADPSLHAVAAPRVLALSRARLEAGDYLTARQGFLEAARLGLSPEDTSEAFFGVAEAALREKDTAAALEAFKSASQQGPEARRVAALLQRAELAQSVQRPADAVESLEALLRLVPRQPEASRLLEQVLEKQEDWAALAELLASQATHAPPAEGAPLLARLGTLYAQKLEQPGPAEAAFRRAAALAPAEADYVRELLTLLLARDSVAEAAPVAEAAAKSLEPAVAATMLEDVATRAYAEPALRLRLLRKADALRPVRGAALRALARALYVDGARVEAWEKLAQVWVQAELLEYPEDATELLLAYADLAEEREEPDTAEAVYQRLRRELPPATVAVERLARLWGRTRPRDAVELLSQSLLAQTPSPRVAEQLLALAARATDELADTELAISLLRQAAGMAADPRSAQERLVELLRDNGRVPELMAELRALSERALGAQDFTAATRALEEVALLAETVGRVDEALASLQRLRELALREGQKVLAAEYERRRAELFRDAKLDLGSAADALEQSYALYPELRTAQLGATLAHRRDDAALEARWVEREVELSLDARTRSHALLRLATLQVGSLQARVAGEASVRLALEADPNLVDAQTLFLRLLEEDGRVAEVAAYHEEAAERASEPLEKARLFRLAATIYRDRAHRPDSAAAALLAARAATPGDLGLTAETADLLHQAGRPMDAAEFDAILLEQDPFREPNFSRHRALLESTHDDQALAGLLVRRAQTQSGEAAAASYLEAADAFRRAGAVERARICEDQAFEQSPASDAAFAALRTRAEGDVRRLAQLLSSRAESVPTEAPALLAERAQALTRAGEALLAAEAWDDVLTVSPEDVAALTARGELAAQGGGPRAAQPYDRRLLGVAGEALPVSTRVRLQLRLGHAALLAGAFSDAADALEAVVALDPEGEAGREALSLLAEVHSRTQNVAGLFGASLRLARGARADEAEALYRRAASLYEDAQPALEALLPLATLRPADAHVVDRALQGLRAAGRTEELFALLQRSAEAVGGSRAATLLMDAANLAREQLHDAERAFVLTERAAALDPHVPGALRTLAGEYRARGAPMALRAVLTQLVTLGAEDDQAALDRLELARLLIAEKELGQARAALQAVLERGASGAGYAEALSLLGPLLTGEEDAGARADLLAAQAELESGEARAAKLLEAATAAAQGGDAVKATRLCRAALAEGPSVDGFSLLARLYLDVGEPAKAAPALVQAAQLGPEERRPELLLVAADAWERAQDFAEARDLIERVAAEFPSALPALEASERLGRLGAVAPALALGFAPRMEGGDYAGALALADAAGDAARSSEALWALVEAGEGGALLERLAPQVLGAGTEGQKLRLGQLAQARGLGEVAARLYRSVLGDGQAGTPSEASAARWVTALEQLGALRPEAALVQALAQGLGAESPVEWVDALLGQARALEVAPAVLAQVAERVGGRRATLWRELFERAREQRDFTAAAEWLGRLALDAQDPRARAALNLELGELSLHLLVDPVQAREAFERVLTDDPSSTSAVRALATVYREAGETARYVAMAERLASLAGPAAVAVERAPLADAYQQLGRRADAYRLLGELEETKERLSRRAALAQELGRTGEALQLREKLADGDLAQLEDIARGYLEQRLLPFAVRLGTQLLDAGQLSAAGERMFAERLANTREGSALSARLWPQLLAQGLTAADDWTLYAEALRQTGHVPEAELADGMGAALTGSTTAVSLPPLRPVTRGVLTEGAVPAGAVPVTVGGMSRLHGALRAALTGLGAPEVEVVLDPEGGAEAWLARPDALVLGMGALGYFGPPELTFLLGLALTLGDAARGLRGLGPVPELAGALEATFAAVPSSLAAARVLALLDDEARGAAQALPAAMQSLADRASFQALAKTVLRRAQGLAS